MKKTLLITILASVCGVVSAQDDTLVNGSATINFNQSAWELLASGYGPTPVLTLDAFFDQADASALTESQLLSDPNPGGGPASYTGETYAMNGASVVNQSGQYNQPTTFSFTPGDLTDATGSIGLGGVARFAVYGGSYGYLLFGDYTLQYSSSRLALGGSGWYLEGNVPPAAAAFDLLNVNIDETADSLTISGDLGVSYEVANYLFDTPSDTLADVGNFSFTADVVPVPEPPVWALLGMAALLPLFLRKKLVTV